MATVVAPSAAQMRMCIGGSPLYIGEEEIAPFCRHAARALCLVEIGAGFGATAALMLLSAPPGARVTSIDPFVPNLSGARSSSARCYANLRALLAGLGDAAAMARWKLLIDDGVHAAMGWAEQIDFLFIDGDHTYGAVRADLKCWFRHLRAGGVLCLHDSRRLPGAPAGKFARGWPGPTHLAGVLRRWRRVALLEEAYSMTFWGKTC